MAFDGDEGRDGGARSQDSADVLAPTGARSVPLDAAAPGVDQVPAILERVLASKSLRQSPQLRRFLDYIVTESLAGRADKLKAYSIATQALRRPPDFDPTRDPIVRVEATRLRAALAAYYRDEGKHELVRLRIAPGAYQPLLEVIDDPRPPMSPPQVANPAADLHGLADLPVPGAHTSKDWLLRLLLAGLVVLMIAQLAVTLNIAQTIASLADGQKRIGGMIERLSSQTGVAGGDNVGSTPDGTQPKFAPPNSPPYAIPSPSR